MRTFFPKKTEMVDASSHRSGAHYAVGVGTEMWGDEAVRVLKVQMSYDGQVAGRKAPSFPVIKENLGQASYDSCPDFDEVVKAVEKSISPLRTWMITWDRPINGPDVSAMVVEAAKKVYTLGDDDFEMPCIGIRTAKFEAGGTASDVRDKILRELHNMGAPSGIKIFVARLSDHATDSL